MGSFSIWHWIIVLVVLAGIATTFVVVVLWALHRAQRAGAAGSARERLAQLEALRDEGRISGEEYARKRREIVSQL